ncbi:MAG: hypothetical protein ACP5RH_07745 [Leptodesmis sp.]|uniref:hypothetical protein n=1 Tax=Leptodesmis sp. TaxID=3100501 RepID=UPI003D1438B8
MTNRAESLKQKFQASMGLPFERVLPEPVVQQVLQAQEVKYRETLYTPIVVLWAWLSQVLDTDNSLSHAVKRVIAWITTPQEDVPSADTGGYSKTRKRLPLGVRKPLLRRSASELTAKVKPEQQWCGRRVKAYDGTTVLMSDTPANQKVYPPHRNQKAGCGFPLANLLAYNLLRTLMWQSVQSTQVSPLRFSLQQSRQQFNHFRPLLAMAVDSQRRLLYTTLLNVISTFCVPRHPNRVEPRVVKRRPKPFPRMQQPRSVLKAKLAA